MIVSNYVRDVLWWIFVWSFVLSCSDGVCVVIRVNDVEFWIELCIVWL